MSEINKKNLEHLAELARIKLNEKEEKKFLSDLEKILDYFTELKEVDTEDVLPLAGGTELKNVFREDTVFEENHFTDAGKIIGQFSENKNGFLKIPPVFE